MSKKPTFGQKIEAMIVMSLVVWLVLGLTSDALNFIMRHWTVFLPLSILAIWWYIHRDGTN